MPTISSKVLLLLGTVVMATVPFGAHKTAQAQSARLQSDRGAPQMIAQSGLEGPAEVSQPISERQTPVSYLFPVNEFVNVTLINNSPSSISYLMPMQGNFQTLEPGQSATVRATDFPVQIGFTQLDGGLTTAEVAAVSPDNKRVSIEFDHVSTPILGMQNIVINDNGYLYLN